MGLLFILLILCSPVFWWICTNNKIESYTMRMKEAQANIEIALIKRYDVITQSMECVKGYMKHEKELFEPLIEVRKGMSSQQLSEAYDAQGKALASILAVAEAYPEIKSDKLFNELQQQITKENEYLSAAKRMYNSNVSLYNQTLVMFPASIVAKRKGCTEQVFLHDSDIASKRDIIIKF